MALHSHDLLTLTFHHGGIAQPFSFDAGLRAHSQLLRGAPIGDQVELRGLALIIATVSFWGRLR